MLYENAVEVCIWIYCRASELVFRLQSPEWVVETIFGLQETAFPSKNLPKSRNRNWPVIEDQIIEIESPKVIGENSIKNIERV